MKNRLTALITIGLCVSQTFIPVHAKENQQEGKETVLEFQEFKYVTDEIDKNAQIIYSSDEMNETYTVLDPKTGQVTDVISVSMKQGSEKSTNDIHTAFFTADKIISGQGETVVTLRFTASVEIYRSGSFRSFQGVNYTTVGMLSPVTSMVFISSASEAHSPNYSFPSTELSYSYTVNVATTGTVSVDIIPILMSAGFSYTTYYYKIVNSAGTFRLY